MMAITARTAAATIALLFGACLAGPVRADVAGLARVIDGDTIEVAGELVRLHGIDAPETKQTCYQGGVEWPCGRNAAATLASETAGRTVICRGNKRDRYGRLLAVCYLGDVDLNARLVQEGWALAYRRYSKDYVADETAARAAGAGIWHGQFEEPWEWRKHGRTAEQR